MIDGPAFVTPHAVRQFIARIAPRLGYDAARAAILGGLRDCGAPKPLRSGAGYYVRVRRGPYLFRAVIVPGEGTKPAVATILRSGK